MALDLFFLVLLRAPGTQQGDCSSSVSSTTFTWPWSVAAAQASLFPATEVRGLQRTRGVPSPLPLVCARTATCSCVCHTTQGRRLRSRLHTVQQAMYPGLG